MKQLETHLKQCISLVVYQLSSHNDPNQATLQGKLTGFYLVTYQRSPAIIMHDTDIRDMLFCGMEWNQCRIFRKMLKRGTDILSLQYMARCTHKLVCKIVDAYLS